MYMYVKGGERISGEYSNSIDLDRWGRTQRQLSGTNDWLARLGLLAIRVAR